MIDPTKITNYNATDEELETLILFWICAAGKNGITAAKCLDKLLTTELKNIYGRHLTPFELIRLVEKQEKNGVAYLTDKLKKTGIGCYNIKAKTFKELANSNLNLRTCSVDDLEAIKGIGKKTSRCFIIHSRPNQQLAGLDRHILSWLKDKGYNVPSSTPTGKKYKQIEQCFLKEAENLGKDIAILDLEIWNEYRNK